MISCYKDRNFLLSIHISKPCIARYFMPICSITFPNAKWNSNSSIASLFHSWIPFQFPRRTMPVRWNELRVHTTNHSAIRHWIKDRLLPLQHWSIFQANSKHRFEFHQNTNFLFSRQIGNKFRYWAGDDGSIINFHQPHVLRERRLLLQEWC